MALRLGSIVDTLGGVLIGDPNALIIGLAPLASAYEGSLSFLSHMRYRADLLESQASCVIVAPDMQAEAEARGACIVVEQPYLYFAKVTQLWKSRLGSIARSDAPKIHPTAVIDPASEIHPTAQIGPLCVIERGAQVGQDTVLHSRVTVSENCLIGARCVLHSGVVIGADGFGFAPNDGAWEKIEQLGSVCVGDDVEIGANTCIDRGALQDTVIENGVKLDNLIQIGHNVRIGRHTAIAGCAGIAGSAEIGANCTVGGGAVILGHLVVADNVHISAASVVTRSILKPGHYTGIFPIDDNAVWEKNAATLKQLHALRIRLRTLENANDRIE